MTESKIFWPLVLFPYAIDNAHTRSFTGRCWIKDIKASFSFARIILSDSKLTCKYRIFNLPIIELSVKDITEVRKLENKPGLILIKFRNATFGKLAKLALSGKPAGTKDQMIINVKYVRVWLDKLEELTVY